MVHFQLDAFLSGNPTHTYLLVLKAIRSVVEHLVSAQAVHSILRLFPHVQNAGPRMNVILLQDHYHFGCFLQD